MAPDLRAKLQGFLEALRERGFSVRLSDLPLPSAEITLDLSGGSILILERSKPPGTGDLPKAGVEARGSER